MPFTDLHTHSTASDGTDSPGELVAKASENGISNIALTDHDTLSGLEEGKKMADELGINFIGGCEISTKNELGSFHVLGLFVPQDNGELNKFLKNVQKIRDDRNELMIEKLNNNNIDVTMEEFKKIAPGQAGRPHLASLLMQKGYVKNREEAFARFLGKNGIAYVPKISPSPEKAVRILAEAGATVSLAHPLLNPIPADIMEKFVRELTACGLSALEAWHSSFDMRTTFYLKELAKKLGLAITGGSDYHGARKPGIKLGETTECQKLDDDIYKDLLIMRENKGLSC